MITLYEQVDRTGDLYRYSWILDGVSGRRGHERTRLEQAGWKWIKGRRAGVYVTDDYALAKQTLPHVFGHVANIISNGTHAVLNAAMYEDCLKSEGVTHV